MSWDGVDAAALSHVPDLHGIIFTARCNVVAANDASNIHAIDTFYEGHTVYMLKIWMLEKYSYQQRLVVYFFSQFSSRYDKPCLNRHGCMCPGQKLIFQIFIPIYRCFCNIQL